MFYQRKDEQFFDYGMAELHGEWFRGPLNPGPDAIAWVGAAQTFGRYVAEPVPAIVGERLGLGTLNLGSGGKGPEFFLRSPELLEEVNRCRVAVIQVMSARTADNSLFRSQKGGDFGIRLDTGAPANGLPIVTELVAEGKRRQGSQIVRESQQAYLQSMKKLLEAVKPPKVLFWFSYRNPPPAIVGYRRMMDIFPHFVTRQMVSQIRQSADRYVAVASRAGIPQVLRDDAGKSVRVNHYYPSPEMHQLAADPLTRTLKELLG